MEGILLRVCSHRCSGGEGGGLKNTQIYCILFVNGPKLLKSLKKSLLMKVTRVYKLSIFIGLFLGREVLPSTSNVTKTWQEIAGIINTTNGWPLFSYVKLDVFTCQGKHGWFFMYKAGMPDFLSAKACIDRLDLI